MTDRALRARAFCERTITYQRDMNDLRKQEAGAIADAEAAGEAPDKIYERINQQKSEITKKWASAKSQVYTVVTNCNLNAKEARILDLRYRRALTWPEVQKSMKYASITGPDYYRKRAFEKLGATVDKLYPDWREGDE